MFSECPYKWYVAYVLRYTHEDGSTEPQRLGTALASGMEVYHKAWQATGHKPGLGLLPAVLQAATVPDLVGSLAHTAMQKSLEKFITKDPTPDEWQVVAVEQERPEHGNCRSDVVFRTPQGLLVRDYKFSVSCEKRWVAGRLATYGQHPQRYHYAWAESAPFFQIVLITGTPCTHHEQVWSTSQQEVDLWLASQQTKWALMDQIEAGTLKPWMSDVHENKYGKCHLTEWCLQHNQDLDVLPLLGYVKKESRDI
jgi:hypothetical protein